MDTVIELRGSAAADAQTLVAYLQDEGIELRPVDRDDRDREIPQVAIDFGVAFLAQASASLVYDLVQRWLDNRGLDKSEADVRSTSAKPTDDDDDSE